MQSYAAAECGYKPGKNIPKCGLPPSAHGVEFSRWNLFTRDCRVAHGFVFAGMKANASE